MEVATYAIALPPPKHLEMYAASCNHTRPPTAVSGRRGAGSASLGGAGSLRHASRVGSALSWSGRMYSELLHF